MRTIQMITISEDASIFLIDFDQDTNDLTFRTSRNPSYKQTEKIEINDNLVYTNLHHFPVEYLQRLIKANNY